MIRRRSRWCNVIGVVLGLLVVAPLSTMLLDRRTVIKLDASKSYIAPSPVRAGDTIALTWSAIPLRNCAGIAIPRVIDSTGHIFEFARIPTVYQDIMRPGQRTFTKFLTLPNGMAPGPARYEAVLIRWCNPVQQYIWTMIDDPFPIPFEVQP